MNLVDAFLLVSGVAYLVAVLLPKPIVKVPNLSGLLENCIFLFFGLSILLNLAVYDQEYVWVALGIMETVNCGLTFLGHQQWNVLWKTEASDAAQIAMWAWDLAIAVCCFMKIGFTF